MVLGAADPSMGWPTLTRFQSAVLVTLVGVCVYHLKPFATLFSLISVLPKYYFQTVGTQAYLYGFAFLSSLMLVAMVTDTSRDPDPL